MCIRDSSNLVQGCLSWEFLESASSSVSCLRQEFGRMFTAEIEVSLVKVGVDSRRSSSASYASYTCIYEVYEDHIFRSDVVIGFTS